MVKKIWLVVLLMFVFFISGVFGASSLTFTSPVNGSYYNYSNILFNVSTTSAPNVSIIPNIDNSLVSWWRMDDTNSTGTKVIDYMGRNNGTAVNGASQVLNGKFGKAMSFDGVNDYVNLGNSSGLKPSNITISAWVKLDSYANSTYSYIQNIVGSDTSYGYSFRVGFDGTSGNADLLTLAWSDPNWQSAKTTTELSLGNWHFVVGTIENIGGVTTGKVYLNGIYEGGDTGSSISYGEGNVTIGRRPNSNRYFNGSIDDVMIFNRSLSADEILSLYNATAYEHTENLSGDGNHTFNSYIQDFAGNVNTTGEVNFVVDTTLPNSTIVAPANNTYTNSTNVTFTANLSDNLRIKNATLEIYNETGLYDSSSVSYDYGKALSFDGANNVGNYVDLGLDSSLEPISTASWCTWVKFRSEGGARYNQDHLINRWHVIGDFQVLTRYEWDNQKYGFWIYEADNNQVGGRFGSGIELPTVGNWYHTCFIANGTNLLVYVNGVPSTDIYSYDGTLDTGFSRGLIIGGRTVQDGVSGGNVDLDEVLIFNRSLNSTEVEQLYNSGVGLYANTSIAPFDSGLVAGYHFDEGTGTIAYDLTGNNNGTLVNSPNWVSGKVPQVSSGSSLNFISGTLTATVGVVVNLVEGVYRWFWRIFDWTGNEDVGVNSTLTIDTTYPLIEFDSSNPADNYGTSNEFNISVLINETNIANVTVHFNNTDYYFDFDENETYFEELNENEYLFSAEFGPLSASEKIEYFVRVVDKAGNYNTTETRIITGNLPPTLVNLNQFPTDLNDLDPGERVFINANLLDEQNNFESAWLEITNNSSNWDDLIHKINMTNSGNRTNVLLNASFELPSYEGEIYYRIFANDSIGAEMESERYNISNFWDCSWKIEESNLGSVGGYDEFKSLKNVTIFNLGDEKYNNETGCIIKFARTMNGLGWDSFANGFSIDYFFNDFTNPSLDNYRGLKYIYNESSVSFLTIPFNENKTLEIQGAFPKSTSVLEENPYFMIASNISDTTDGKSEVTINLGMIVTSGAYLENIIEESPKEIIDLIPGEYSFKAYVRNVVGSSEEKNTAHNVSFNWEVPNEILPLFDYENLSEIYEILNDSDPRYINLTLNLTESHLKNLQESNYTLWTFAQGYENYSSDELKLIQHTNGEKINKSVYFEFRCPPLSYNGITADVCKPKEISSPGSSGGGGGGSSSSGKQEISEAQFELVNGEISEFQLPIKNKYPEPLTNLKISVTGINSEFIEFPSTIDLIPGNGEVNLTVKITAPAYFQEGNYSLRFRIDGFVQSNTTKSPYSESKLVTLYILDMSRETASSLVEEASSMLEELTNLNLYTKDLEKLLIQLNNNLNLTEFSKLKTNYETFKFNYNSAKESLTILEELRNGIQEAERNGINVFESKKLMLLGEQAMNRGAYQLALERLKEAKLTFAIETKGEFNLLYLIKNNPLESLGILMATLIVTTSGTLITRRTLLRRRLKLLKQEQILLLDLMKIVQRETFELNHMSMDEYLPAMQQYESRLQESVEKEVMTETQLAQLGRMKGKKKALIQEKDRLIDLVRDIQTKYLIKGEMETRIYQNTMKSYTKRLTEVEEALVFLEAKEYLRGNR